MKKEIIAFVKDIPPNTTDTLAERVKYDGAVEEIRVRFYPGVERDLKVRPFVEHKGNMAEDLFSFPSTGETTIRGDDDYLEFSVHVPVEYDDFIKVWAQNLNANYTYTLAVYVVVQYMPEPVGRKEKRK